MEIIMKNILIFFVWLLIGVDSFAVPSQTVVNCIAPISWNEKKAHIRIYNYDRTTTELESVVKQCKVKFIIPLQQSSPAQLWLDSTGTDGAVDFFLDAPTVMVIFSTDTLNNSKITGSPLSAKWKDYYDEKFHVSMMELVRISGLKRQARERNDTTAVSTFDKSLDETRKNLNEVTIKTIRNNQRNFIGLYLLSVNFNAYSFEDVIDLFNGLDKKLNIHAGYAALRKTVQNRIPGQMAANFTLSTINQQNIELRKLRGKVVFIDFWASWCRGCREANPGLKSLYNTFQTRGFEILGVSLDDDKTAWQKAIEQDELPWLNGCDLLVMKSPIVKRYHVQQIPDNVLIDKNGLIIARDIPVQRLEEELKKVFSQP